jgi:hypothetical protein
MSQLVSPKIVLKYYEQAKKHDSELAKQLLSYCPLKQPLKILTEVREILSRMKVEQMRVMEVVQAEVLASDNPQVRELFDEEHIALVGRFVQDVIYCHFHFLGVQAPQQQDVYNGPVSEIKGSGWRVRRRDGHDYILLSAKLLEWGQNPVPEGPLFVEGLIIELNHDLVMRIIQGELGSFGLHLNRLRQSLVKSVIPVPKQIIENQLFYSKPGQLTLFDMLQDKKVREKVTKAKDMGIIVTEGIKPTASEERLLKSLYKIIKPRMASGTMQYDGEDSIGKIAVLTFTPSELYEAYELEKCRNNRQFDYSGSDRETVRNALISLSEKKFLIRYMRPFMDDQGMPLYRNGEQRWRIIESYTNLYNIVSSIEDITSSELKDVATVEKKTLIKLYVNPILLDQIDKNYVNYPTDMYSQIKLVYRRQRIPDYIIQFINYLIDKYHIHKLNRNQVHEINVDNIAYMTGLSEYYEKKRQKRFTECLMNMFSVAHDIGLVHSANLVSGAHGQAKARLEFNFEYL